MKLKLEPKISDRDIERFTCGDCHFLARALNKLDSRLEIVCFYDRENVPDIHAFVCIPADMCYDDLRYLDINGLHTPEKMCMAWNWHKRAYNIERIGYVEWPYLRGEFSGKGKPKHGHHTYARARSLANQLYEYYVEGE